MTEFCEYCGNESEYELYYQNGAWLCAECFNGGVTYSRFKELNFDDSHLNR